MYERTETRRYREWKELDENEKEKVREAGDTGVGFDIWDAAFDAVKENFQRLVVDAGLPENMDLYWSLSHSQGDGCSMAGVFSATPEILRKVGADSEIIRLVEDDSPYIRVEVRQQGRYCHEYTMSVSVEPHGFPDELEEKVYDLERPLLEYVREVCVKAAKEGYEIIEEQTNDKAFEERCAVDGVLFDENLEPQYGLLFEFQDEEEDQKKTLLRQVRDSRQATPDGPK